MRLRTRLLLLVTPIVVLTVATVAWLVSSSAERAFVRLDEQRTAALVSQFRRQFDRERADTARLVERLAASDAVARMSIGLAARDPDRAAYVNDATTLAAASGLDLLDLVLDDGTIVSSAAWPGRFGYKHPLAAASATRPSPPVQLRIEELPSGRALALMVERAAGTGGRPLFVVGGRSVDRAFLASLVLPAGTRVLLYRNFDAGFAPEQFLDPSGRPTDTRPLQALIDRVRARGQESSEIVRWPDHQEAFSALPLVGPDGTVPGVLLVGSSRRELTALQAGIRRSAIVVGLAGVVAGVLLSYVVAGRVTRPVERLVEGAGRVAGGDWTAQVEVARSGELATLGEGFNRMTAQLAEQRDRLVQAERVAAWRELARRLAHELKNPLFPLRITLDNLRKARALPPPGFDEVFEESTATLAGGLANLNTVIGRFSDFARMPAPALERVDLNEVVRRTLSLFDAQLREPGRPPVSALVDLDDGIGPLRLDPEQVGRMLQNLVLNAIDAMPSGGRITIRTRRADGGVLVEVTDTGEGLTDEERTRLFTPYYTSRRHGTGLGLAIVQSVVSDHRGRISVRSQKGHGTTFLIELPAEP